MKVTRDQIKARAQELRNQRFTIKATLEMNAGARPISSAPKHVSIDSVKKAEPVAPAEEVPESDVLGKSA
jgi:hypothetical protein